MLKSLTFGFIRQRSIQLTFYFLMTYKHINIKFVIFYHFFSHNQNSFAKEKRRINMAAKYQNNDIFRLFNMKKFSDVIYPPLRAFQTRILKMYFIFLTRISKKFK